MAQHSTAWQGPAQPAHPTRATAAQPSPAHTSPAQACLPHSDEIGMRGERVVFGGTLLGPYEALGATTTTGTITAQPDTAQPTSALHSTAQSAWHSTAQPGRAQPADGPS